MIVIVTVVMMMMMIIIIILIRMMGDEENHRAKRYHISSDECIYILGHVANVGTSYKFER